MTTSFADFVATQDARNDIQLKIREYCLMLCDALAQDFVHESIKRCNFFAANGSESKEYYEQRIQRLKNGEDHYKFYIESGRKYHKIVMVSNQRSVHAFVDKKTGELYKAASWRGPAKDVRFDLSDSASREHVYEHCDWSGGYLYKS